MTTPPHKGPRGEDFRSTGAEVSPRDNALLDALLRDVKARQEMVRGLLEDLDEAHPKRFVSSSSSLADGAETVAQRISIALQLPTRRTDWGGTADDFFKRIRTATEELGVFVLLVGDLGSHHSALSEEVFRGFALADPVAPFIVINDHDARTARSFTLIHELAHIYLGQSGVSGSPESVKENSEEGTGWALLQRCSWTCAASEKPLYRGSGETLDRQRTTRCFSAPAAGLDYCISLPGSEQLVCGPLVVI